MYYTSDNVDSETVDKIRAARSLTGRPGEPPLTPYRNIGQVLAERSAQTPDKAWLTFYDEGEPANHYTYREFDSAVRRLAAFMSLDLGIRTGDRIATMTVNDSRTVLVYFAAWLLGVTV